MKETCKNLQARLNSLDYGRLWPGFHLFPFAIYDDKNVFFPDRPTLPWDPRFSGNTAIDFEGKPLAIWNGKESPVSDQDVLTAKLVHEMFHAFQKEQGETRWANEMEGLRYVYDAGNLCKKYMENFHLSGFNYSFSLETWRILLAFRNARAAAFPEAIRYESRIETIEGLAQFVELGVLRQLDLGKFRVGVRQISDFLNDPKKLFPIRGACYQSGTMMCIIAEENGIPFHHEIGRETRPLHEILGEGIPAHDHKVRIQSVVTETEAFLAERHERLERFLDSAETVWSGNLDLVGFDPMNGFLDGNRLFSPRFLMVKNASGSHYLEGESVAVMDESFRITEVFQKRG